MSEAREAAGLPMDLGEPVEVGQGRPPAPGWIRLSTPGRKLDARYKHVASGWVVRHCGHPTANFPYFAVDPAHPLDCTVTHNGRGWVLLTAAFEAIDRVLRGELVATSSRCVPGVRRICLPDDDRELPETTTERRRGRRGRRR